MAGQRKQRGSRRSGGGPPGAGRKGEGPRADADRPRRQPRPQAGGQKPLYLPPAGREERPGPLPPIRLKVERKSRHPWVFLKMCERPGPGGPAPGDAVAVYDRRRRFVGRGLFNPRSQIAVRILDADAAGEGADLDAAFFEARVADAVRLRREALRLDEVADAFRVVNSEGDHLSGLIVDRYGSSAVVEIASLGLWRRRAWIEQALCAHLGVDDVIYRADARVQATEGFEAPPALQPREATVREHGVLFGVDLAHGHKTGLFCDQRDNRRWVAARAAGRRLLDLCCYTGGFGLHAAVNGGAREVVGVDLDERAIARAVENAALNGLEAEAGGPRFVHANVHRFLRQAQVRGGAAPRWDIVVLDPPKLVHARSERERGLREYFDLNRRALRVVAPGGLLVTCSCSGLVAGTDFLEMLAAAAFEADRRVHVLELRGPGPDHPVDPACPEGVYLKVAMVVVR